MCPIASLLFRYASFLGLFPHLNKECDLILITVRVGGGVHREEKEKNEDRTEISQ